MAIILNLSNDVEFSTSIKCNNANVTRRRSQFASLYVAPDTKSNAHSIDFNIQHNAWAF